MDPEQLAANRTQLARLARQKSKRRVPRELPCDWRPMTVPNPGDNNQPFTEAGAWEFIAELLENAAQEVTTITLHTPPDRTAFVMQCSLPGFEALYFKVHFG